jgi:Domain of unknown function (DUF4157)
MLRRWGWGAGPATAPVIVHEVLGSPGQSLDRGTRTFMESRLGHDFEDVRVHTGVRAERSARAVNARAYTVDSDLVFAAGQYQPETEGGRQLLAHELTHVIQQSGTRRGAPKGPLAVDSSDSASEREARVVASSLQTPARSGVRISAVGSTTVARADPTTVAQTMQLGTTQGTGVQFWPVNVVDTQVGPVSVSGGLAGGGVRRLHVIVGENLTLRTLARQILPLWTTATPFTPPGAGAPLPLDLITEDELAQGLLVYNQTHLPVPSMSNWRAGFLFPLPVEIDAAGMATLHPLQIKRLSGAFGPAWMPLLATRAPGTSAPPPATTTAEVAAFLTSEPTALGRGTHLRARALTNAVANLPFIREAFVQLGTAGFDVALEFMGNAVNQQISSLAAQRDGAAILVEIRAALASPPAAPSPDQQAGLDRANHMLGLVAGVAAIAPPGATRARPEKTVTIDTVRLAGASHDPAVAVAAANGIFSQCNVRLAHGVNATASAAQTTAWLGDQDLVTSPSCGTVSREERTVFQGATAAFGLTARIRAFFPATISGTSDVAYAVPPFCATGPAAAVRGMIVVSNRTTREDLAHEVGHVLLNSDDHPRATLMSPSGGRATTRLTDPQCRTIHSNA